jgi:hypothetical protein
MDRDTRHTVPSFAVTSRAILERHSRLILLRARGKSLDWYDLRFHHGKYLALPEPDDLLPSQARPPPAGLITSRFDAVSAPRLSKDPHRQCAASFPLIN